MGGFLVGNGLCGSALGAGRDRSNLVGFNLAICMHSDLDISARANHLGDSALLNTKGISQLLLGALSGEVFAKGEFLHG